MGETLTQAVVVAVREQLARRTGRTRSISLREELAAITELRGLTGARHPSRGHDSRLRRARVARLMVIDTSALVAMLNDEPEAQRFEIAVAADHVWLMSTASYPEMATVIETRFGEPGT